MKTHAAEAEARQEEVKDLILPFEGIVLTFTKTVKLGSSPRPPKLNRNSGPIGNDIRRNVVPRFELASNVERTTATTRKYVWLMVSKTILKKCMHKKTKANLSGGKAKRRKSKRGGTTLRGP